MTQWQFWVDRGGTFTDLVAKSPSGALSTHKLLSVNPDQYDDAAVQGIRDIMGMEPGQTLPTNSIASVKMGTTVATNALLEREGEPTVLVTTAGLEDLLRIGYQNRPSLFDLEIKLPEQLYGHVIGADERISASGDVLRALDQDLLSKDLKSAHAQGFRSVAIAFMHGYRFTVHEEIARDLARAQGFEQVSTSFETSPLIKLVSRGDTTVVDAYLSPVLRRYIDKVRDALGEALATENALLFMQSNGGLTSSQSFEGKDAILSGPAGGVVGMVRTAQAIGRNKLIGFDMGGTSTDVCHYAGSFETTFETEVAGVRMRAPMMNIHTVAAGGGSILSFDDGRLQVGPASAGSHPGPACYRKGGPLTVTDCNVLLGRLQPQHFPSLFGPKADQPLDKDIVRQKFDSLARDIAEERGEPPLSAEALAKGFLKIAVQNMSNAVKKISVQRGYDVTTYTLNSFGGAGGQHACMVADDLGMDQVFLHPYAGVLSAFGMGLADIKTSRQMQFDRPVSMMPEALPLLDRLAKEASAKIKEQGVEPQNISMIKRLHVRTEGGHQALPLTLCEPSALKAAFSAVHVDRFGFRPATDRLVIEMLDVEAIGKTGEAAHLGETKGWPNAVVGSASVFVEDKWVEVDVVDRDRLGDGAEIIGPALVAETTGTTFVDRGWNARTLQGGNLLLERAEKRENVQAAGTDADPIMLEIFNNQFISIADQMGATLENTAFSVNIKERLDFSCALFDAAGDLVANAPHVPVHLGSMSDSVKKILSDNAGEIRPGDVFMMNNPFNGGTHLPDVTVISPVFDTAGATIIATVASRGHHADIGGKTPGSAPPDSRHIEEEGVLIDNFLLVRSGEIREDAVRTLLASGLYPCRDIDQNLADLKAQIAANNKGQGALLDLVGNYGLTTVQAYMGHVKDNAEESVRRVIDVLDDCRFTHELDTGEKISVSITVDHAQREALVDFTGTSPQHPLNYNAPASICRAVVLYVFRTLVGKNIPMNEGCLKPLRLRIPEDSMINPRFPAAVISGNTEVSQAIAEALYGALGVIAGSQGTMNNFVYGNDGFQNYETICGGTGAGPSFDGVSAVHSHMTNTRMTDPEVLESRFPLRVEGFSIRKGSGGQGQHAGGEGIERKLRFLDDVTVTVLSSNRQSQPHGAKGGTPGQVGENVVERHDGSVERLKGNDRADLQGGDCFIMLTPGGGGYGKAGGSHT